VVVVEADDLVSVVQQVPGEVSPQKASGSGYEIFHGDVLGVSGQVDQWTDALQIETGFLA